jgi:hypothetical protein
MTLPIAETVENAYRIFARYRIGKRLAVCHCPVCMTEEDEALLVATPLWAIPAPLLAEFTNSAHDTEAEGRPADELRHFLPRYFELLAAGEPPDHMGLEICLRRLGHSGFRGVWPKDEVAAIDAFFDAFMTQRIHDLAMTCWPPYGQRGTIYELTARTDETLTCLITGGAEIVQILAAWDKVPDPAGAVHMAAARQRIAYRDGTPYFRDAHLDSDHRQAGEAIAAFLLRPVVTERIEAAFLAADRPGIEQILANGVL